jgi:NAD(P)-dependent dehydrogenase (short-subunit alcohol dehydrogenase family)
MNPLARLGGKRVLITGTGGGQGAAAQRLFAEHGARIAGCDVQPGSAEATAEELRAKGFEVTGRTVDLTDPAAAARWVQEAAAVLGGIDVLYNNAAGARFAPFAEMDYELWNWVLRAELDIVFHTTRAAWGYLADGGGSLINTASYSALRAIEPLAQVAHAAAKGGVLSMTRALAGEGARHGIRANSISPGFVRSAATDRNVDDIGRVWQVANTLLGRPGEVDDIAYLAMYLASDESSWVTGQDMVIDGGATAGWRDDVETTRLQVKRAAGGRV